MVSVLCASSAEGQTGAEPVPEASEAPPESPTDDDGWPDISGSWTRAWQRLGASLNWHDTTGEEGDT
jgi:hypothetical protein